MKIEISDTVKMFTGGSWHYVLCTSDQYLNIKREYKGFKSRGFGSIPVQITLGKSKWVTSIFPMKEGKYILFLKKKIREVEDVKVGDKVILELEL